jgi:crotonobetainyl-CoA:carnitine CoA-transferase CaiB-like acyl-CoA transferase
VKLSRTPAKIRTKPKKFGADTRAVLSERGFSDAEIDTLISTGIALTEIRKS